MGESPDVLTVSPNALASHVDDLQTTMASRQLRMNRIASTFGLLDGKHD
jgi:hypothetical protein